MIQYRGVNNMDDKVFELIEKMYVDLKNEIKTVGNQVANLENTLTPKVEALLDGYKQLAEGQEEIKSQIQDLQSKVDNQEVEITVLKGGKEKHAL